MVSQEKTVLVLESMKMQHDVVAPAGGRVSGQRRPGRHRERRATPAVIELADVAAVQADDAGAMIWTRSARIWPRSSPVTARPSTTPGPKRSRAGARPDSEPRARTSTTSSTTGSFVEYGALAVAAQRRRRSVEELIAQTPADGIVCGLGRSTATCSTTTPRGASSCPTTTPCSPARRACDHARRTGCSSSRSAAAADRALRRRRRRTARRHRRRRRRRPRLHGFHLLRDGCPGSCRSSASTRAAASPATPRCSAAAT